MWREHPVLLYTVLNATQLTAANGFGSNKLIICCLLLSTTPPCLSEPLSLTLPLHVSVTLSLAIIQLSVRHHLKLYAAWNQICVQVTQSLRYCPCTTCSYEDKLLTKTCDHCSSVHLWSCSYFRHLLTIYISTIYLYCWCDINTQCLRVETVVKPVRLIYIHWGWSSLRTVCSERCSKVDMLTAEDFTRCAYCGFWNQCFLPVKRRTSRRTNVNLFSTSCMT